MLTPASRILLLSLLALPLTVSADPPEPSQETGSDYDGFSPVTLPKTDDSKPKVVSEKTKTRSTVAKDEQDEQPVVSKTAQEHSDEAMRLLSAGDQAGAQQQVKLARQADPQNQQLAALEKLVTSHVNTGLNASNLKDKAKALLEQRQDTTAGPQDTAAAAQQGLTLASPITWPFGGGAAGAKELINSPARDFSRLDAGKEGMLKMNMKDYPGAEQALSRRIAEDPRDWQSLRNRGFARFKLKKFPGAIDDTTRAIALNPRDLGAYKVRALTLAEIQRYQEALVDLNTVLELAPKDAKAHVERADVLGHLGQPEKQLEDLREAAILDPQFEALYDDALKERGLGRKARPLSGKSMAVYLSAIGMALFLFAYAFLRRRGDSLIRTRTPIRQADRLEGRFTAAPQGFQVLRQVGEGGMGVVYEAFDVVLQRKVAIKRMREEIAGDERERRRFLKEARTVAAMKHPNIVEIHSVLEKDDGLYLVFEYVDGMTLSQLIAGKPYSPSGALGLARQIGHALDHAHGHGIIHQDLKPSNIMVWGGVAKVMDFGIARRLADPLSTLSRGQIVGTPQYMSPEQEQGQATKESDLYAFGLCFYEMLSGKSPFPGGGSVFQKLEKSYRPLSEASAGLPKALDPVMDRALDPHPGKRFPSAAAFLAELEGVIKPTRR